MRNRRIHNRPELKTFRKKLRNNGTSAEATLWGYLKQRQLCGRKFRRQHSIGNYIVDFYCPEEQLVIELDGEDHFWEESVRTDHHRTVYLNKLGIKVIRLENKWVFEDIDFVLTEVQKFFL
ncbi:MAG: endonuclease domain-containing protein [Bacteroidota bacterium]